MLNPLKDEKVGEDGECPNISVNGKQPVKL